MNTNEYKYTDRDVYKLEKYFTAYEEYLRSMYIHVPSFSIDYFYKTSRGHSFIIKDGTYISEDIHNEYMNVTYGFRNTTDQLEQSENTIYLLGHSVMFGAFCEDKNTIASNLQNICNTKMPGRFNVSNRSVRACKYSNAFLIFSQLPLKHGDVVIFSTCRIVGESFAENGVSRTNKGIAHILKNIHGTCQEKGCSFAFFALPKLKYVLNPSDWERIAVFGVRDPEIIKDRSPHLFPERHTPLPLLDILSAQGVSAYDLQPYFNRPHSLGEVFVDDAHLSPAGCAEVARLMYGKFLRHLSLRSKKEEAVRREAYRGLRKTILENMLGKEGNERIDEWIEESRSVHFSEKKNIGAIVMNANPFTNGHLYLVEKALSQVDGLYIFVVEENKSIFSFKERFEMIQSGLKHLQNKVHIIPSGKFIISSLTFPEYFDKENAQTSVDTSQDIILFGAVIAPKLNITRRFVGEEPNCIITASYNKTMQEVLPYMGVDVTVIPRIEQGGLPVSASRVRALREENDYAELKKLVPESTFYHESLRSRPICKP